MGNFWLGPPFLSAQEIILNLSIPMDQLRAPRGCVLRIGAD